MDCPHGNWWFVPWHRGYIGWFETICRELSGDPEFALPYWDWTALPQVPDVMYDDVLTPSHPAFLATLPEFQKRYKDIVAKAGYWKRTVTSDGFDEDTQYGQLLNRGIRTADDLWFDIGDDPRGKFFFARAHARGRTKDAPQLDGPTAKAVSWSSSRSHTGAVMRTTRSRPTRMARTAATQATAGRSRDTASSAPLPGARPGGIVEVAAGKTVGGDLTAYLRGRLVEAAGRNVRLAADRSPRWRRRNRDASLTCSSPSWPASYAATL